MATTQDTKPYTETPVDTGSESDDELSPANTGSQIDDRSESQVGESEGEEDWEDWEEDNETCVCLFCDKTLASAKETLVHCKDAHSFDFAAVKTNLGLDFYKTMRLVNYIRHQVKEQAVNSWNSAPFQSITPTHPLFSDDQFLKPVLQDDALLFSLGDSDDVEAFSDEDIAVPAPSSTDDVKELYLASEKRARAAEDKVLQLERLVMEYQAVMAKSLSEAAQKQQDQTPQDQTEKPQTQQPVTIEEQHADTSDFDAYFTSYAHFGIHESMLKDAVRTDSYRDAIYLNKHIIKDKTVLDIGTGTSILSMFAAKAGAKQVISIDRSDIILKAQKIVVQNELDKIITLVRGKAEEVVLPVEKVDIIISEWMGYFLLFESMLDTVIYARDKWLKPDGIVQPSFMHMLLTAGSMEEYYNDHIAYWSDVYGFKMDCMREPVLKECQVDVVETDEIMGTSAVLKTFDILHMKNEDQAFIAPFEITVTKEGPCHAFIGYFDTEFTWNANPKNNNNKDEQIVKFSTGPHATPTHWRQAVFLLESPIPDLKVGDKLKGTLTNRKDTQYFRALNVLIEYWVEKDGVKSSDTKSQYYILG